MTRFLLAVWLIFGVYFAVASMYAEVLVHAAAEVISKAAQQAKQHPSEATPTLVLAMEHALADLEEATSVAPFQKHTRAFTTRMAATNPAMPDEKAIEIFRNELNKDPYNASLLMFLALRLAHSGDMPGARAVYMKSKTLWGPNEMIEKIAPELK